jgi:hypothetical protein
MKKLILISSVAMFFGCANGTWHTGNAISDVALTQATGAITSGILGAATKVAEGSDAKAALVQASGDALRSLEATGITTVQPAINAVLNKWLPKGVNWGVYAKQVGTIINNYVANHGNNNQAVNAALEAAATALNTYTGPQT